MPRNTNAERNFEVGIENQEVEKIVGQAKEQEKIKEAREIEHAPIPERLQHIMEEISSLEEAEEKIHEQAQEITEILKSLEPANSLEGRIQEKLGEEMERLGKSLVDNIDKIRELKEEEQAVLDDWSRRETVKEQTKATAQELGVTEKEAQFFGVGEDKELLARSEELKTLYDASPEEVREMMFSAMPELNKEGVKISKEDLEEIREKQKETFLSEAKEYEERYREAEKEAKSLEKMATFEEKNIQKTIDKWKSEGIDIESEERSMAGSAKIALRKLFSKKFKLDYFVYSLAKERAGHLREDADFARLGASGSKEEAALLKEAAKSGDMADLVKSSSLAVARRALRTDAVLRMNPVGKIRSFLGIS